MSHALAVETRAAFWGKVLDRHVESEEFSEEKRRRLRRRAVSIRRKITNLYLVEACKFLRAGQCKEARERLWHALANHPLRYENYVYLMFACLPNSLYQAVRKLKRTLLQEP
jgi:hypothetical protein